MTIVNLIQRYKRWNPVHPTYGAFWGLGLGLGCGVGWGPGFGPEAVGFVGSGCGVGFSVGVTLVGIGIGLPASGFTCLPWNAIIWAGQGASNATSTIVLPTLVSIAHQSSVTVSHQITSFNSGISNLYKTQIPRSQRFMLDSRKRFLWKLQGARKKSGTWEDNVLQMQPLDPNQQSEHPPRPPSVSFSALQRTSGSPTDVSKDAQSQSLSEESKEK